MQHVMPEIEIITNIMVSVGSLIPAFYIVGVILQWLLRKYIKVWFRKLFPCFSNELTPLVQRN